MMSEKIPQNTLTPAEPEELSPAAQREQDALQASIERMRVERLTLEEENRTLEALLLRKEKMIRRQQELLAEIQAEHQAIEAEFQRLSIGMPMSR